MATVAFASSCNIIPESQRRKHRNFPIALSVKASKTDWAADGDHLRTISKNLKIPQSPHSESHFVRCPRSPPKPFFEGWYLRAVLPETSQSFAFMFSVEANSSGTIGTVQVAGPDDKNLVHALRGGLTGFAASQTALEMCHWGSASAAAGEPRFLKRLDFERHVFTGYQLSATHCSGRVPQASAGVMDWNIDFSPVVSWGERFQMPRYTATWVSRFPVFEPGYQILMAHGVATKGNVRYAGKSYNLAGARMYAEKNWGASFPSKWWWVQANAFAGVPDLSITAVGAKRMIVAWEETVGMIAVHLDGHLYEFSNWTGKMEWDVVWGRWEARAKSRTGHEAIMSAETSEKGVEVLGPTTEGLAPTVLDAMHGKITLTLLDPQGKTLLDGAECGTAQVEIGGGPWESGEAWRAAVAELPQPVRGAVNLLNGGSARTLA